MEKVCILGEAGNGPNLPAVTTQACSPSHGLAPRTQELPVAHSPAVIQTAWCATNVRMGGWVAKAHGGRDDTLPGEHRVHAPPT